MDRSKRLLFLLLTGFIGVLIVDSAQAQVSSSPCEEVISLFESCFGEKDNYPVSGYASWVDSSRFVETDSSLPAVKLFEPVSDSPAPASQPPLLSASSDAAEKVSRYGESAARRLLLSRKPSHPFSAAAVQAPSPSVVQPPFLGQSAPHASIEPESPATRSSVSAPSPSAKKHSQHLKSAHHHDSSVNSRIRAPAPSTKKHSHDHIKSGRHSSVSSGPAGLTGAVTPSPSISPPSPFTTDLTPPSIISPTSPFTTDITPPAIISPPSPFTTDITPPAVISPPSPFTTDITSPRVFASSHSHQENTIPLPIAGHSFLETSSPFSFPDLTSTRGVLSESSLGTIIPRHTLDTSAEDALSPSSSHLSSAPSSSPEPAISSSTRSPPQSQDNPRLSACASLIRIPLQEMCQCVSRDRQDFNRQPRFLPYYDLEGAAAFYGVADVCTRIGG